MTVSLPFAHGPFQVLFPILDAFNHDHSAEVNWSFDRDAFSMTVEEPKKQGEEVFNNYGRKANEERKSQSSLTPGLKTKTRQSETNLIQC